MVVLVTGCRSGFGLSTAVELARRGHTVYAGLRDLETAGALREAARDLPVHPVQLDVTVGAEREDVVSRILREQGRIDALVNNAGVALGGFLEQVEEDELRKVFEVNVFGVHALTALVVPHLREQGRGHVVMVSSMAGRMAMPGLGVYASSKFALEAMSEAWHRELAPFGVVVQVVQPGAYQTDIWSRNRSVCRRAAEEGPYAARRDHMEGLYASMVDRAHDPTDVASTIAAMLSKEERRFRVPMGPSARQRVWMQRLLPAPVLDWMIQRKTLP